MKNQKHDVRVGQLRVYHNIVYVVLSIKSGAGLVDRAEIMPLTPEHASKQTEWNCESMVIDQILCDVDE